MLAACLEGDQQAWDLLVERYTRLVYSIALKSGLGEQDAADVVQNVFTIVLRRLESLQQPDRFSAWLITTTHRESWRFKRAQREIGLADGVDPVDQVVAEGLKVAMPETSAPTPSGTGTNEPRSGLSPRELEVLRLIVDGRSNREIGDNLFISTRTVATHVAHILSKLGLDSRAAAAAYAVRNGIA
jgi:DNA-binding NarL/FixJ family response regulator